MQHVRRATLRQRLALLDAEAVLLVDDGDGEIAKLDALLDQCVRADDDVDLLRELALTLPRRAREQRARDAELLAEIGDREEVLLGERLGRGHQRALAAVLDGAQQRIERDDRLARADVALQQPLHRRRAREVRVDLADRLLLVRRERERQRLAVAPDQLARVAERGCERPLALGGAARDADLQQQQLLEREPPPPRFRLLCRRRMVHDRERIGLERQLLAHAHVGGQRVVHVVRVRQRRSDERADLLRRDLLAGRIHRREVGRRVAVADVVRLHGEAARTRTCRAGACARPARAALRATAG